MPTDSFQKLSQRLGFTRNEREMVEKFRQLHSDSQSTADYFAGLHEFSSPAEIYDLFHGLPLMTTVACLVSLGFSERKRMKTVQDAFLTYKRKWEKLKVELDGNDLMELGVPQGKQVGIYLNALLHAKLIGQVPDRMDEVRYIQRQLKADVLPSGLAAPLDNPTHAVEPEGLSPHEH